MPTDTPYSIADLARLTGVSVRTIRYYLAQGLIPASGESGPGAHYAEGHLARLRLVRRLQQQHLPLAEIREQLAGLTDEEVTALGVEAPAAQPVAETSALDYIRSVLAGSHRAVAPSGPVQPAAAWNVVAPPPPAPTLALREAPAAGRFASRLAKVEPPDPAPTSIERSQWERLSLGPNLELHVRRPLSRLEQKRVERLITIARQVLKEEQP